MSLSREDMFDVLRKAHDRVISSGESLDVCILRVAYMHGLRTALCSVQKVERDDAEAPAEVREEKDESFDLGRAKAEEVIEFLINEEDGA